MAKHYYWGITLNFCSGHTEKKKKKQVKDLAIWHWLLSLGSEVLFILRGGLPPVCPKEGKAISWILPELQSLSSHHLSFSTIHIQILFLIDSENAEFWRLAVQSLHAQRQKPKRKNMCVCVCAHVCIYQKRFQRRNLCPYKFVTAAKLTVSSVKDQLWGEKLHNTIKHLLQNTVY